MSAINEIHAANAFSKQSAVFDKIYGSDTIIQYKRDRVRGHVSQFIKPGSRMLELNAGTGEDAIFFATQGHSVHATDISTGMQQQLAQKVAASGLCQMVTQEICSYTGLHKLNEKGPYDYIFSNFAGLNCTNELDKVLHSFTSLLNHKGIVTLVILPKFCVWEFLLLFKGKTKTALRRFCVKKGARSHIEGEYFRCWYYNPSYVIRHLEKDFTLIGLEGLCTLVPPSYIEGFAEKRPGLFRWLVNMENRCKRLYPFRVMGDYYIISFMKKT